MAGVWHDYGVMLNPAGAVAYAAAEKLSQHLEEGSHIISLVTGHPARRPELVERAIGRQPEIPAKLEELQRDFKPLATIGADVIALEGAIASCY
jgi:threonine synthase